VAGSSCSSPNSGGSWTILVLLLIVPPAAEAQAPFDVAAATDAYLAQLTTAEKARSDAYFEGGYWLLLWTFLFGVVEMWLILRLGWSARMRNLAARVVRRPLLVPALYAVQFVLLTAVIEFPLTWYTGFVREHLRPGHPDFRGLVR
jgi:STE24 endopeptidase